MAGELIQDELNPGESEGNEFDNFVIEGGKTTVATTEQNTNEFDDLVVEIDNEKSEPAAANLYNSKDVNPDQSAKALDLATKTGLPHDVAENEYDNLLHDVKSADNSKIVEGSTALQKYLVDGTNAKISSDDLFTLDGIQKQIGGLFKQTEEQEASAERKLQRSLEYHPFEDPLIEHFRSGSSEVVRFLLGTVPEGMGQLLKSTANQADPLVTGIDNRERPGRDEAAYWFQPSSWLIEAGQGGKRLADYIDIPQERETIGTDITKAVSQITAQVGLGAYNATLGIASLFGMGADQMANRPEILEDPRDLRDMKIITGSVGTGVSEKIGLDFLTRALPPESRRKFLSFLTDKVLSGGAEAVQEVVEGMWHDITAAVERSGNTLDIDTEKDIFNWEELWQQAGTAFAGAATFRTLMEGFIPGRARGSVSRAEANVDKYKKIKESVLESKTFERHKGKFEEFAGNALEDSVDPNVYFDAEQINTFFQSGDDNQIQDVMETLGVSADEFGQAVSSGGDIKVPLNKFLNLADTEFYDPMLQDIRTEQGDSTLREELEAEESKDIEAEAAKIIEERAADVTFQEEVKQVRETMTEQLMTTGKFSKDTAEKEASLYEAFVVTQATREGVSVAEIVSSTLGLKVQADLTPVAQNEAFIKDVRKFRAPSDKKVYGESLIQFLANQGGLSDEGGELSVRDAASAHRGKPGQKQLVKAEGMSFDSALEAAVQAGYIVGDLGQLTHADLLEAIDSELGGAPVYSDVNVDQSLSAKVDQIEQARDQLMQAGIDIEKATDQEINDALFGKAEEDVATFRQDAKLPGTEGEITDEKTGQQTASGRGQAQQRQAIIEGTKSRDDSQALAEFERVKSGEIVTFNHRSPNDFETFDDAHLDDIVETRTPSTHFGHYLSADDVGNAGRHGDVTSVYQFQLKNPLIISADAFESATEGLTHEEAIAKRKLFMELGHDGILVEGLNWAIVFESSTATKLTEDTGALDTFFQSPQAEQAQRNHMNLWSKVEQSALSMKVPAWMAKPKKVLTNDERTRLQGFMDAPMMVSTADPGYQEYQDLLAKQEKELASANGKDIWAKLKSEGLKKEELEWLGIEDFLNSKPKFTRDEVVSFVRENGVVVDETLAEGDVAEEELDFSSTVWDDPEAWEHRIDDLMSEFDDGERDDKLYDGAVEEIFSDEDSYIRANFDFEGNDVDPNIEDFSDSIEIIQWVDENFADELRNKYEEGVGNLAKEEYMQDPMHIYHDKNTDLYIFGNIDLGYTISTGNYGNLGNVISTGEIYSYSEAVIQSYDYAHERGLLADEEDESTPKWAEYVTEGDHDNYRELKLILPDIEGKGTEDAFYNDTHFPDANLVAFLRLTDRSLETTPGSGATFNQTYFIDEFQSDWHQNGRQQGYQLDSEDAGELDQQAVGKMHKFREAIEGKNINDKISVLLETDPGDYDAVTYAEFLELTRYVAVGNKSLPPRLSHITSEGQKEVTKFIENLDEFKEHKDDIAEAYRLLERAQTQRHGVMDAPFKGDGWITLGLKRAIIDAVEQGKESFAWVDSNVLTDRWSDRYKSLYETQYDKKMPSIVKKLTKQKPKHMSLFQGREFDTVESYLGRHEIVTTDEGAIKIVDETGGTVINNFDSMERAETWLQDTAKESVKELGYWTIPLTDELKERVRNDGFALFQKSSKDKPKGQIQFPPGKESIITLFESSDLSTFLHETGHFFLQSYINLAETSPRVKEELDTIMKWMGVTDARHIGIDEHEKFAEGFENYLHEGKAPNAKLQDAFNSFRQWLIQVYKTLVPSTKAKLNDDIRGVMDRMLATDEAIVEAESTSSLLPLYTDAVAAGMTESEYEDYQRSYERATNAARVDTDAELLARLKREQTEAWKKERNTTRDEILEALYSLPAVQARWFFMRGTLPNGDDLPGIKPVKLSRDALTEMYGDGPAALWRELPFGKYSVWTKESEGIHPDEIAAVFGFANGDAMVQAMVDTKGNLNKLATEEAELNMRTKYGDPDSNEAIAALALEAVQNQERSNFLGIELRALEKRAGLSTTPRNVIKRAAERILNGTRIGEIKEQAYLRTSNKWARKAVEFAEAQQFEEAADAKRKQLLNQAVYQEAIKSRKYVDTKVNYLKKFNSPGVRKNLARDYLDQIDAVLEAYELKKTVSLKEVERRKSLNSWIESQTEQGLEVIIPKDLIERARRRSYKDLPLEEFKGLVDSVKNIEHIAKFKQQLIVGKEKRDFNELIEDLVSVAVDSNKMKVQKIGLKTELDKAKSFGREFMASHVKMEFLLQQLDGDVPNGQWWNAVFRPIAEAEDAEIVMSQEYMTKLNEIFEQYGSKGRAGLYKEVVPGSEVILGRSIKRAELISMALNWGNDGNRKALMRGEDWTEDQIIKVLNDNMTQADWNTVQSSWDLIDSLWPEISALQKDLTGVVPAKVEATTVTTKFGTFTGGYYPLQYDIERNIKAFKYEEKMTVDEMFGGNYTMPSTRQGHTVERVGSDGMAVKLDLDVMGSHLINVIHDLTHRKAIMQADHILQNKQVAEVIISATSRELYQHARPWLAGIASDRRPFSGWMEQAVGRLRRGATAVNMGWKFTTAIVQPLGYLQSVEIIGNKYAMKGLHRFYGNPLKAKNVINEVFSKSTMMANRSKTFDRDIRDAVRRIKGDSLNSKIQRSLFSHIGFMDYSVTIPTWIGAYEKNMDEQKAEGKTLNESDSIAYADSVVRMSQSAGGAKDLAAIQRGSEYQRSFTMFYSYFSVLHNLIRKRGRLAKKGGVTAANVTRTTMSMLYLVVLPAVLAELIVARGPDDEEDEEFLPWAANVALAYPFMTMVGVRDAANVLSTGYSYQATPILDAVETSLASGIALKDTIFDEDKEFDRDDTKNIVMTTGYLFGLPARQLYTSGEHLYSVLNDEEEFSLYELLYRNKRD